MLQEEKAGSQRGTGVHTRLQVRWPRTTLSKINDSNVLAILQDRQCVCLCPRAPQVSMEH